MAHVSTSTMGLCNPGAPVTFDLVLVSPGQTPAQIGSTSATSTGSVPPTSVTVPSNATPGVNVLFSLCSGPNGPEIVAASLVIVPPAGAKTASPRAAVMTGPSNTTPWSPPSSWATPSVRVMAVDAVNSAAGSSILAPTAQQTSGPSQSQLEAALAASRSHASQGAGPNPLIYILPALALLGVGASLWLRRRSLPNH